MRSKPGASTFTSYSPAISAGKLNSPCSDVMMDRAKPVAWLASFTCAPATAPRDGSRATPAMVPVGAWALKSRISVRNRINFFMAPLPAAKYCAASRLPPFPVDRPRAPRRSDSSALHVHLPQSRYQPTELSKWLKRSAPVPYLARFVESFRSRIAVLLIFRDPFPIRPEVRLNRNRRSAASCQRRPGAPIVVRRIVPYDPTAVQV